MLEKFSNQQLENLFNVKGGTHALLADGGYIPNNEFMKHNASLVLTSVNDD